MGKIVKYCAVCEESFSDKFSFCPNCAAELTAYEMNPVKAEPQSVEPPVKIFEPTNEMAGEKFEAQTVQSFDLPEPASALPVETTIEPSFEPTVPAFHVNVDSLSEDILEFEGEAAVEEEKTLVTAPAFSVSAGVLESFDNAQEMEMSPSSPQQRFGEGYNTEKISSNKLAGDDGFYHITFVEAKDTGTRNMLLLGAAILVLGFALISVITSIYNADAYVGALDDDLNNIVFAPSDDPTQIEPDPIVEKKEDKGGGGGGDNDPNPVSKGQLANQSEKPMMAPSVTMDRVTNPEIPVIMETKGNRKADLTDRYGDPNSKFDVASDGPGSGGGQGTGRNGGQGSGDGPGIGPGSGGGSGGGNRGGNGGDDGDPPPEIKKGPTVGLQITSKPRANYTDAARQAQVQGTVTLRVTFMANGSVGNISAISGLPNGLTEQAIAAARSIRFTPAMQNGVPKTVVKQVQYTFTLY